MEPLYFEAEKTLKLFLDKSGSLKSLIFSSCPSTKLHASLSFKKKLYALVSQTIKHYDVIKSIVEKSSVSKCKSKHISKHLQVILVYDLLLGRGIQCGGPLKYFIMPFKSELKTLFYKEPIKCDIAPSTWNHSLPRYARVNLIKISMQEATALLQVEDYRYLSAEELFNHLETCLQFETQNSKLLSSVSCNHKIFCQDSLVSDLLMFCPLAPVTQTSLYLHSQLILQDKASCIPALVLCPQPGSEVIDACAAPGNKSSQLASLMNNTGTVYAFDKSRARYNSLKNMIAKSGARCIKSHCQDFLEVNPSEFPSVRYILVDPSCSGSGIVDRLNHPEQVIKKERLLSLSNFQKHILKHALSFPAVERVVYSTCSVHYDENEAVVKDALQTYQSSFQLTHALPQWRRRGDPMFEKGDCCIRTSKEDLTNGFFVALFERL